tara:strand:+ start:1341 stop:1880 length:540 start_codon:yes stop_codon:yes gene_type:complete
MTRNNAEMSKDEKKVQLIGMFIKTEKKLPAHIKSTLNALLKCVKNDMNNFDSYWSSIVTTCAALSSYGIDNPVGRGKMGELPYNVEANIEIICNGIYEVNVTSYKSSKLLAVMAKGKNLSAVTAQEYADKEVRTLRRNLQDWYKNHCKIGTTSFNPKVRTWDGKLKSGLPVFGYPEVKE